MSFARILPPALFALFLAGAIVGTRSEVPKPARQPAGVPTVEYATARFMEERTSIVWADGTVENVVELSGRKRFENGGDKYPKGSDYRMYWLPAAMNLMAQRGDELAHMQDNDVVMRRAVGR